MSRPGVHCLWHDPQFYLHTEVSSNQDTIGAMCFQQSTTASHLLMWAKSGMSWYACENGYNSIDTSRPDMFLSLLLFYILATYKVISGRLPTCDSAHSWWVCSGAPLENQAVSTMTWPDLTWRDIPHNPDTELSSPCPMLIMLNTWLGSNKYQFNKSLVWLYHGVACTISCTQDQCSIDSATSPCPPSWYDLRCCRYANLQTPNQWTLTYRYKSGNYLHGFVCLLLLFYAIATVFQFYLGSDMIVFLVKSFFTYIFINSSFPKLHLRTTFVCVWIGA